jgi:crossover junction endodeoxyribonuclease RuvC
MITLGIDPGLSGAVALLRDGNLLYVYDVPSLALKAKGRNVDLPQLARIFAEIVDVAGTPDECWIEEVHAMPKQGVSSSFKFGTAFGIVQGMAAAHMMPIRFVSPHHWKKGLALPQGKDAARGTASRQWPTMAEHFARVKDDGRAEAALIALYGFRQSRAREAA